MDNRDYIILLYDYYGELFSIKQREYFEDYYFNNLSFSEMAEDYDMSRNAAFKQIHIVTDKLVEYEEKLKLLQKKKMLTEIIENVKDVDIKKKLESIF